MNIVLVHGILGFREKFGIEYFRGVAEHLTAKGHKVISPILDPTRGIEYRGGQLRDQVNAALANGNLDAAQKTDIFAHSMGGLDSRWMLSPANPSRIQAPIRSLTTMSTPHLGSPIADLIDAPEKLAPFSHLPFGPRPDLLRPSLAALGISLDGLRNLTTAYCKQFSETYTTIRRSLTFPSPELAARASLPLARSFSCFINTFRRLRAKQTTVWSP